MGRASIAAAIVAAGTIVAACEITQAHIDEASERLAQATVMVGSAPSQTAIAGGTALQSGHLSGSSWRIGEVSDWPTAVAVVTMGTNGRTVWHVAPSHLHAHTHWSVSGGSLRFTGTHARSVAAMPGVRVDADNVCLEDRGNTCGLVMQRVTP
ncbi:MAG: hypothetical protein OXJ90_12155 [Spirochaetaceae bacterium]|nr:hypothetical protein [Spirochaetaceae bacterium]